MISLDRRYAGSMGVNRNQLRIISFNRLFFLEQKFANSKVSGIGRGINLGAYGVGCCVMRFMCEGSQLGNCLS